MIHPLSSADINIFYQQIAIFLIMENKEKRQKLHLNTSFVILLTFIEFLKAALINTI